MNIISLNGGLGNQLFQYSFGLALKYEYGYEVKFCKKCCISNQRPNSSIEFLHNRKSKKKTISITFKSKPILRPSAFTDVRNISPAPKS